LRNYPFTDVRNNKVGGKAGKPTNNPTDENPPLYITAINVTYSGPKFIRIYEGQLI
jgi:hypothetical protein